MKDDDATAPGGGAEMKEKIMYTLMEMQMILPGVQMLIGFQAGAMFSDGFDKLPMDSKVVFGATLAFLSLSMLLLMMPSAFHRYVERGEATERFHQFSSRILLWSLLPFGAGLCGNLYIIVAKVTEMPILAAVCAIVGFAFLQGLWFGYMAWRRRKVDRHAGWLPSFD